VGKCFKCGRSAGFMLNKCDSCVQLEDAGEERAHLARIAPTLATPITDGDGDPVSVSCPYCLHDISLRARKCWHCGEWRGPRPTSPLTVWGGLLLSAGFIGMLYGFSVSAGVPVDSALFSGREVNNIGLLNDKQDIILVSGFVAVVGAVLVGAGAQRKPE